MSNVGDVIAYQPARANRWCREGVAILVETRSGHQYWRDTYWGCPSQDDHILTDEEVATAERKFNIDDYDELDQYARSSPAEWETYAPADRESIPSQHGLQRRWFIRKGAKPDHDTKVENARQKLQQRVDEARTAALRVEWAQEDLDRAIRGES